MRYIFLITVIILAQVSFAASEGISSYLETSREFERLLNKSSMENKLPSIENKEAGKIIDRLSKSQLDIVSKKYSHNDLGYLIDICEKANKFGMTYLLHNMRSVVNKTDSAQQVQLKIAKLMTENSIKYQNELEVFYPFLIDCLAIQSSLIEDFWKSLPAGQRTQIRKNGIIKMRTGILQVYEGVLTSLGNQDLNVTFKSSLLKSASNAAPVMSSLLSLDKRNAVLRLLGQLKETVSKKHAEDFDDISKAFSRKDCNEICQI